MTGIVRDVLSILTPGERRRGLIVLALAMANAVLEAFAVLSVFPFLAVLGRPQVIDQYAILRRVYDALGFQNRNAFLLALGGAVLVMAVITTAVKLSSDYALFRYTNMRRHSVSLRLVERYLAQRPTFFLRANSADILTTVLAEVDQIISILIRPLGTFVSSSFAALLLITLLAFVDAKLVALVVIGLGGSYGLVYLFVRKRLEVIGRRRRAANETRYRVLSEALGGIKEVKLMGLEGSFLDRFSAASHSYASSQAQHESISQMPKGFIQFLAFAGIILTSMRLVGAQGDITAALPVLGLFAVAAYRLMPALQAAYAALTNIRFGAAVLASLQKQLRALMPAEDTEQTDARMPVRDSIALRNVTFGYPESNRQAVRNVSLTIRANSAVAFVGMTGAGKTTAADLILALLEPTSGELVVDGTAVTRKNRRAWQNNVGYVAQHIFLTDDSVARNIAFGAASVDMDAVRAAAKLAQIDEFVMTQLPQGYDTEIGERGVRLSGGQRQRLGIARALYRNPAVLVFDEATSHLDNATENAVVRAVASLAGEKTVIVIAHRLTTVRNCDEIFVFSDGAVVGSGTYNQLRETSREFQLIEQSGDPEDAEPERAPTA